MYLSTFMFDDFMSIFWIILNLDYFESNNTLGNNVGGDVEMQLSL